MRRSDNTIVFGSQNAPGPASQNVPGPTSSRTESQWFDRPVVATTETGTALPAVAPMRTVGADLMPDRHGYVAPSPDRGLVFAAISLALIGVAAAGTYFFLGIESTAKTDTPALVSTTNLTSADVPPTPAEPPPPPPATAENKDLAPWEPPVVDAVKAPNMPKRIEGAQLPPTPRQEPAAAAPATAPKAKQAPSDMTPSVDDAALQRAGFYRNMAPASPTSNAMVAPPPAPSPPTTPNTEMVPPLTVPPTIDGTNKTNLPLNDDSEPKAPAPAPTDVLPDVQIQR